MNMNLFPEFIQEHIKGMILSEESIGRSEAFVYKVFDDNKELFLKYCIRSEEFNRELLIMKWLEDKLLVPKIIALSSDDIYDYLLMTKVPGSMACSKNFLDNPHGLVKSLAEGIKQVQQVDINDCPIDLSLKYKLDIAYERVKANQVDMSSWEDTTLFESPEALYKYLVDNKPNEDLVFTHGDYCLPNIFIENNNVSGYIDLGRSGVADKWQDISLCIRSLEHNLGSKEYNDIFFYHLGIKPDYDMIDYYILLDELF